MLLFFAALSFAFVMMVFDSAALDYRLVVAGSLLPWLDYLWGAPWVMHSVFFPVAVMIAVMVVGWGRRLAQRRWLGLAIGLFAHLVLSATWTNAELFWWPAFGIGVDGARPPIAPLGVLIAFEVFGAIVALWLWRRLGLSRTDHRKTMLGTGRIDRTVLRG